MAKRSVEEQQALNKEYQRELRNLKRRVETKRKKGYSIPESIIPNKPKVITPESILNLKKRTGEYIAKKSVYISPEGTKVKGTERLKQERSEASKKGAETRRKNYYKSRPEVKIAPPEMRANDIKDTLENIREQIEQWTPSNYWSEELIVYKTRDKNRVQGILDGALAELGEEQVALNAMQNADELNRLLGKVLYESGNKYREDSRGNEINRSINRISHILRGRSLTNKESEELTELIERTESHELPT